MTTEEAEELRVLTEAEVIPVEELTKEKVLDKVGVEKQEIKGLPEGWKISVGTHPQTKGKKAYVDWQGGELAFENEEARNNPEIVAHELAHIMLGSLNETAKEKC